MNEFSFEIPLSWIWLKAALLGTAALLFGIFSAVWPQRSIALYERLMARINWRVSPLDEAREIRNTRLLGALLILLGLLLLGIFMRKQI